LQQPCCGFAVLDPEMLIVRKCDIDIVRRLGQLRAQMLKMLPDKGDCLFQRLITARGDKAELFN
jgi:hypothetical protein